MRVVKLGLSQNKFCCCC